MITFAIGDIHGHLDELDKTLDACARYADGRPYRNVFLGDYVDRGPDTKGVICRLMERTAVGDIALFGNHEEMLLNAAITDSDEHVKFWVDHGGYPTLVSYGLHDRIEARRLPKDHLEWMRRLPLFHDDGLRFYCHANIIPGIPLHSQQRAVLIWTRDPLSPNIRLERLIVHGHVPTEDARPRLTPTELCLDTGCGFGRSLSAAVFDQTTRNPMAFIVGGEVEELIQAASA
jgi:serine/threonine protein phosphatase 1